MNEDNVLIARFMGWQVLQSGGGFFRAFKPNAKNPTSVKAVCGWRAEKDCWLSISQKVQYHKSWDWLMPVVEKINEIYRVGPSIEGINVELYKVLSMQIGTEIEYVYSGVVNFIKWYNKNK